MKRLQRWGWTGLLVAAGLALWMLLAGSGKILGLDTGSLGMALLITTAWISLAMVAKMPRGGFEHAIAPGEWQARIGLVFMAVATVYFLVKLPGFQHEAWPHAPYSRAVATRLVLLLVAWTLLSKVLAARWQGRVQKDERDCEIEVRAGEWGRGALIAAVVVLAVTLGVSPADRLLWATHFMLANLMVLALMCGWLVEYAATAALYWRDRRGVA